MTHLEVENLVSDYLEGLLEPSQRAAVDAHLTECATCCDLLGDVRQALELCREVEIAEPKPWLISRIMLATVGEQRPTFRERLAAYFRPILQPRVAYPIAMTVFTFSIIVNAAGLNLKRLQIEDLNPRTWLDRANRQGHLLVGRAEKFYYDLRVVVEIESRIRQLGGQPQNQEEQTPKPETPAGGSSQDAPSDQVVASNRATWKAVAARSEQVVPAALDLSGVGGAGRSLVR
jgi:hypothetical protein